MAESLRDELAAAAAAGVIAPSQVGPLADFIDQRRAAPVAGEEELRFIRNFHDVFLATGIALLAGGLWAMIALTTDDSKSWLGLLLALVSGVVMWGLAEAFARKRRLFLPAIAACLGFTGFAAYIVAIFIGVTLGAEEESLGATMAAAALIAGFVFYLRFKLPFSAGLVGLSAAILAFALADLALGDQAKDYVSVVSGVGLFIAGLVFDIRDPARRTRFSDNGFWLHFAAAPFILHGVVSLAGGAQFEPSTGAALTTLAIVALLGLISLLINRRALIVSALITTGVAVGALMRNAGLSDSALFGATLIVLGLAVVVLGAGWHVLRRALLGWVKPEGFAARIFPPEAPE